MQWHMHINLPVEVESDSRHPRLHRTLIPLQCIADKSESDRGCIVLRD